MGDKNRFITIMLTALFSASTAFGSVFVSNTTPGNWSALSTWATQDGGTVRRVPAVGDNVTIRGNVTVDTDVTVGSDPATGGMAAVALDNSQVGIVLILAAGKSLRCRGDINVFSAGSGLIDYNTIQMNAGASLILDPKDNGTQYNIVCTNGNGQIICSGTDQSRCTVKTDLTRAGGAAASKESMIVSQFWNQGILTAAYTDFINLGTTSAIGVYAKVDGSADVSITHCTFQDASYSQYYNNGTHTGTVTFSYNKFSNSTGLRNGGFLWCCSFGELGGSTITDNVFDLFVEMGGWHTTTQVKRNVFLKYVSINSPETNATPNPDYWSGNFHCATGLLAHPGSPALKNNYFFMNGPTEAAMVGRRTGICSTYVLDGNILEGPDNPGGADGVGTSQGTKVTAKNNIILKAANTGRSSSSFISMNGFLHRPGNSVTAEHNTFCGNDNEGGVVKLCEGTDATYVGSVASVKSNLCWSDQSPSTDNNANYAIRSYPSGTDVDAVTDAGYNAFWNPKAGQCIEAGVGAVSTPGYGNVNSPGWMTISQAKWPTWGPNNHDVTVNSDPFVDRTRNLRTWGAARAGADGTDAGAVAALAANPALIADLLSWVRAGFAPTNIALKAAHDAANPTTAAGAWIGAVAGDSGQPVRTELTGKPRECKR